MGQLGKVEVGAGKTNTFHKMFVIAQRKNQGDAMLDGIVNQWMICRAKDIDALEGFRRTGPQERSLRGKMISPKKYLY